MAESRRIYDFAIYIEVFRYGVSEFLSPLEERQKNLDIRDSKENMTPDKVIPANVWVRIFRFLKMQRRISLQRDFVCWHKPNVYDRAGHAQTDTLRETM